MSNLVIVESPAKAKTIEKFLGKGFTVKSCFGHIRDLVKKGMGIDLKANFAPIYEVPKDKKKVVNELKREAKKAKVVWLATDEDREGEAIAWHLAQELNLDIDLTKRIVFSEITKTAIKNAVEHPRKLNLNLVNAQQARRIIDRLVGFEISPVLWNKISFGLSAGRVQSVAVRLIVEREREIKAHQATSCFKSEAVFNKDEEFKAKLNKEMDEAQAEQFMQKVAKGEFYVAKIEKKQTKKSPSAPFTTSTLQRTASQHLGYSVKQTMVLAQRLYEAGHITYMRTDSVNMSNDAVRQASVFIEKNYGSEYLTNRKYKTKNNSAQEAHEAIRPTDFSKLHCGNDEKQKKLYQLIWKRSLATQMSEARIARTQAQIVTDNCQEFHFLAVGEIVEFEGFLVLYKNSEKNETFLPNLKEGDALELVSCRTRESFSRPPPRYNEAALVKVLEENGIGRPSTYAPTISTIQDREYVIKGDREGQPRKYKVIEFIENKLKNYIDEENFGVEKNKLFPTNTGTLVNDFLVKHFKHIVDYSFTASLENKFDMIANKSANWEQQVCDFYTEFHPLIDAVTTVDRDEVIKARVLGIDKKTNRQVSVRFGRYGPFAQIGTKDEEEKPIFASLLPTQNLEDIELDDALKLFRLPMVVGVAPETFVAKSIDNTEYLVAEGTELVVNKGPFGPYIKFGEKKFAPIKCDDPFNVTLEEAFSAVKLKLTKDAEKLVKSFADDKNIAILKGRWGPYIHDYENKLNAKIFKNEDAQKFSLEECKKRLKDSGKPAFGARKKTTKSKKKT